MGNREGYVYKVINNRDNYVEEGDIVVMVDDDGTNSPFFDIIQGGIVDDKKRRCIYTSTLEQIWPIPEKNPVETIILMGKEYSKEDIENALKDVMPVGE